MIIKDEKKEVYLTGECSWDGKKLIKKSAEQLRGITNFYASKVLTIESVEIAVKRIYSVFLG